MNAMKNLFNTEDNKLFIGVKADLIKTNKKGTEQYDIWLQKYRAKRQKKYEDIQPDLFKSEIIEEAFRGAGEQAVSIFNVLRRQDDTDKTSDSSIRIKNQILSLMDSLPELNLDMNSLEENYFRLPGEMEGAESKIYLSEDKDFVIKAQDFQFSQSLH